MGITLKDVARQANTSVASASATLHGSRGQSIRVSEATRDRIRQAASSLGYVSNPIAKSLATGKSWTLGLMLPYVEAFVDENPFCSQVMHGVFQEAVRRQYNLVLYTAVSDPEKQPPKHMFDSRVDGVLLVMPSDESPVFNFCERQNMLYVSILQNPVQQAWCVNADDYAGGRLATEHLLSLGHTRIVHLSGTEEVASTHRRERGFRDAMLEAGIEPRSIHVEPSGFAAVYGFEAMRRIFERGGSSRPTAVFACNDLAAEGAIRAIREFGLRVPEDIAVVGYDDTRFATMVQPPLTSVHMPIREMGEVAAKILIDRLEGIQVEETRPVLPVTLTIRNSCGTVSAPDWHGSQTFRAYAQ